MAVVLPIPKAFNDQGWKAKVQDKERNEEPHITLIWRKYRWRWGLRRRGFMDSQPDPKEVPTGLVDWLEEEYEEAVAAWDRAYPSNPVSGD